MGHQETVEEIRAKKAEKFNELKDKKNSSEYEEWFLRYRPTDKKSKSADESNNKITNKTKSNKKKKRKTRKRKGIFF